MSVLLLELGSTFPRETNFRVADFLPSFKGGKEKGSCGERPRVWVTCRVGTPTFRLQVGKCDHPMADVTVPFTVTSGQGQGAAVGALCRKAWSERILKVRQGGLQRRPSVWE